MKIHTMSTLTHVRTHTHLHIRKRSSRGSASAAKIFDLNLKIVAASIHTLLSASLIIFHLCNAQVAPRIQYVA